MNKLFTCLIFVLLGFSNFIYADPYSSPVASNVSSVAFVTASGSYKSGTVIDINVTFTQTEAVTGTPRIDLNSGGGAFANYFSGNGTTVLTFRYIVGAGENSPSLDYNSTSSLALNGGTITNGGTPATLTLPATGNLTGIIIDTTAPTVSIGAPSLSLTKNTNVTFGITYTGASTINLTAGNITLNKTGTANGTVGVTNGTTSTPTVTISGITGDGTLGITIASGTSSDAATNADVGAGPSTTFTVDNTPPTVSIGAPSLSLTKNTNVTFGITYTGASTINLTAGNITLNKTGTANGTVGVTNGTTSTPTVTISGITGDGTLGITIASGTSSDAATNADVGAGPSTTFTVDNTPPTVSIGAPSLSLTKNTNVTFGITYTGASTINLTAGNITLNKTGTANGTVGVTNGTTSTPTVTISGITGDGTLGITIASGTSSDAATNADVGAGPSTTFTVDNTPPTVSIGAPSLSLTKNTNVTFGITYTGASTINLTAGDITLNKTGTANGTVGVTNGTTSTPTVTISGITGDGTLGITIASGTSSDAVTNADVGAGPSTTFTVDNTVPAALTVGSLTTTGGTISAGYWNITNTGLNVVVPLTAADASLDGGSVQIQIQNTTTNTFVNVANSGLSVITNGQRTGGTKTVSITAADLEGTSGFIEGLVGGASGSETQFVQVRAVVSDLAGNSTNWTKSATNIDVDQTPPTITAASFQASFVSANDPSFTTCNGSAISGSSSSDSNREMVHLTVSEPLNLVNGASIPTGSPGFAASTGGFSGCSTHGGTAYHPTNTIHLKSGNDGDWTSATTFSFTPGGTVVKDAAGNEMGTFSGLLPGDTTPPELATGLVFNANGNSPETIVFAFDGPLNPAVTNTVTGFTTSVGTIAGGANYNSATHTVTLTSTADGMWTDAVTLSYDQATGNVTDAANNELIAFGGPAPAPAEPIFFTAVHIQSNNGTNTAFATTGNTTTLTFNVARPLATPPTVTFYGATAPTTLTGPVGSTYTATLNMTVGMSEVVIPIQIIAPESIKSTTTTATTDSPSGSKVTFDKTPPSVTPVSIASNNANNAYAKVGDVVTVSYTATDNLGTISISPATIDGFAASSVSSTFATLTTTSSDNNGVMPFSITFKDQAGNTTVQTATTNSSSVTFDKVPPVVASIATSSALKGIGTTNGIVACPTCSNTSVSFLVTFTEANTPLTGIDATDFTVSTTGSVSYTTLGVSVTSATTRTVTVNGINGFGKISLGLVNDNTIHDVVGNTLSGSLAASFTGTQYYTIVLPEPSNASFVLTPSNVTSNSVTLSWNSTNVAQIPTNFLVLARPTTGSPYPGVNDGFPVANSALVQNVIRVSGTNTYTFNGLNSGTSYDFIVYKYTLNSFNSSDNIDYELSSAASANGVITNSAAVSWITLTSSGSPLQSTNDNSGNSATIMSFKIFDDGLNPISPNVMTLHPNGSSPETITFTLTDQLTMPDGITVLPDGTSVLPGFTSSSGTIASAVCSGGGTTITLTSVADGQWNGASTISYSASVGSLLFKNFGKMQSIAGHALAVATDNVVTINTNGGGIFTVPAGVTSIQVEAWGAGGSGGEFSNGYVPNGSSGGGGGGAYSRSLLTVTPGTTFNYVVGAGGAARPPQACCVFGTNGGTTSFGPSLVVAEGGWAGLPSAWYGVYGPTDANPPYTYGGRSSVGIGDFKYDGGQGGFGQTGTSASGGGGGSSAGNTGNGNNGSFGILCTLCLSPGGPAPLGGGPGGAGFQAAPGNAGVSPGGGGGGVGGAFFSGAGADGQIKITYSTPAGGGTSDWALDNSPFKFSQLVFTQGVGTSPALVGNLQNLIAGAELSDGTNIFNSITNPSDVHINASNITFSNLPSTTSTDIGYVPDANGSISAKTYTLKVWLKNNLSNALAASIDNLNLDFKLDATIAANLTYDDVTNSNQKSSRLASPEPSFTSGPEQIKVDAIKLVYNTPGNAPTNTNPQPQIGVGIPFSSSNLQVPEVYAVDANNNLDRDYNYSANITNPLQNFGQSATTGTFSLGKLSLSSFDFTTGSTSLLNTQLVVTGPLSPATTPATSTNVWPVISSLTTITAGPTALASELASFPSTTNSLPASFNFDFAITDDAGADATGFTNNDALPTIIPSLTISQDPNNGINGADPFNDWTKTILGAQLKDVNTATTVNVTTIAASTLVFNLPAAMQTIADGGTKTYQLRIWLKNPIDPTLQDLLDNEDYAFSISQSNLGVAAPNTTSAYANSSTNTGDGRNVVTVTATQFDFVTQWAASANQYYDAPLDADAVTVGTQSPAAKARDANGNLDRDFNTATTVATLSPALYPVANAAVVVSNGLISFNPSLQVTSTGGGSDPGATSLKLTSGAINGTSNAFNLHYSNSSDIIRDNLFTHSQNILYANFQAATFGASANPSSIGVALERFKVEDGGPGNNDADGTGTSIQSITLNLTNGQFLRTVALYNGTTEVAEVPVNATYFNSVTGDLTFSSLSTPFSTAPKGNGFLTVYATFNSANVTDNQVIQVKVTSVTAPSTKSSTFAPAGTSTTFASLAPYENQIEVVATQIIYTSIVPSTPSINVPVAVTVQAQDANGNLDADYNGAVSIPGAHPNGNTSDYSVLNLPSGNFSGGVLNYPGAFQFTSGTSSTQLVLNGGPANTVGSVDAGAITGQSPPLNVLTSFDSWLYFDPTFAYTPEIDFVPFTGGSGNTSNTSQALGRVILSDGGALAGTRNLSAGFHSDADGAFTEISNFTISLGPNFSDIKKIGLYTVGGVQIGSDQLPGATVTFGGLNTSSYRAPDNDAIAFVIRAVFNNSITDQHQITLQITNVTPSAGSKFPENNTPPAATIAGIAGGDATPSNRNYLDVIATSLDFLTQPSTYAGLAPSPVGQDPLLPTTTAGKVTARDTYGNVDTNFVTDAVSSGGIRLSDGGGNTITPPSTPGWGFVNGVIDLTGMQYNSTGNGTVRVQTKNSAALGSIPVSLDSKNPINNTGNSVLSTPVNVVNTTVQYNPSGLSVAQDNTGQANLKGGKTGLSIFGLTFAASGSVGAEPILNGFTIGFKTGTHSSAASLANQWYYNSNTAVTVFNPSTLKILYNGVDITTKGGIITPLASTNPGEFDLVKVDISGFTNSHSLSSNADVVLQVDVSSTTNGATQTLVPYLTDAAFGSSSDGNIVVSNGTAYSIGSLIGTPNLAGNSSFEIDGIEFNFASASPPKLLADINIYPTTLTRPFTPQSNVDPVKLAGVSATKPQVVLQFDTNVGVLDDPTNANAPTGSIFNRSTNTKVADLYFDVSGSQVQAQVAANGQTISNNAVYKKLIFNVCDPGKPNQPLSTPLAYDGVYYVQIAAGKYDQLNKVGTGIADLQLNFFGGVSDNFTLYFKTWSSTAPTVSDVKSPPDATNFNTTAVGTISATFDQSGTAYFSVVPHSPLNSASTFTSNQIKTGTVPGQVNGSTGSYSVQINQLGTAGIGPHQIFQFAANLSTSIDYDVYIYTENNASPSVGSSSNYFYPNLITGSVIKDPATTTRLNPNTPLYQICPDSYITLTQPMIIMENSGSGKGFFYKNSDQTVNILLPTGYEFDTKVPPTVLLGPATNDFTNIVSNPGSGTKLYTSFNSNSILQLRFNNSGVANYDVISISGLRVIGKRDPLTGALPSQGDIVWFYGSDALTSYSGPYNNGNPSIPIVPLKLATIGPLVPSVVPDFTNSYWVHSDSVAAYHTTTAIALNNQAASYMHGSLGPPIVNGKVNAIPDNFGSQVRLLPLSSTFSINEDFYASTFTGSGVSGDLLTLSAVSKDAPFNIVMNHTDVNGCAYSQTEQYLVYDHNSPISTKLGVTSPSTINPATNLPFVRGTVQDIVNSNFNSATPAASPIVGSLGVAEKAGYSLLELQADLPISEVALNGKGRSSQLISGANWRTLVRAMPINNYASSAFVNATWDYAAILNASASTVVNSTPFPASSILSVGSFTNVYDYFKQVSQNTGNYFWQGGSLGKVEFTGLYMNSADNSIFVPFKQDVELFVPSVPLIEIQSPSPSYDLNDFTTNSKAKAPTFNQFQYPGGYKGTATFCEFGGQISLIGHPTASGGSSIGSFGIYDLASFSYSTNTGTAITTGFIDNRNGTVTIDPTDVGIKNSYNDILVTYTYQDNNSPAIGTGYLVIRVSPNPVANFTQTSSGPNASAPAALCVNNLIDFDASASTINGAAIGNNATYKWFFADPNSNAGTNPNTSTLAKPSHKYTVSLTYNVTLDLVSNFGCPSIPNATSTTPGSLVHSVKVGDIPNVDFSFLGNCVKDTITFTYNPNTGLPNSDLPAGANSSVAKFDWQFGDGTAGVPDFTGYNLAINPAPPFNYPSGAKDGINVWHIYSTPKPFTATLTTATDLGCSNNATKGLIQLPLKSPSSGSAFQEDFVTSGGWQPLNLKGAVPSTTGTSWAYDAALTKWKVVNNYPGGENSALYSACLDLSTIPRPVLSLASYINLGSGEGLVVQYSTDKKNIQDAYKQWTVLGTTSTGSSPGLFWYNSAALTSHPGTGYPNSTNPSSFGWNYSDTTLYPKHKLEDVPSNSKRVVLRFALGTANGALAGATKPGLTIDSVRVGSRTRTILFENFTTTNAGSDATLNGNIKSDADSISAFINRNIRSTQLVSINYHVGFLGPDPFNMDNPADPSARALYYNVTKIPYAFLDGKHSSNPQVTPASDSSFFRSWGQGAYDLQTLDLAKADFLDAPNPVTTVISDNTDGYLHINVNVTPRLTLPIGKPNGTKLFIAVLEKMVKSIPSTGKITTGETQFQYVLKKMIPDASGTEITKPLTKDIPVSLGSFKWIPGNLYSDSLTVIVFLQNEGTKEVYQADLFDVHKPSKVVTAIEPISSENIKVYPNPADQEFVIELPYAAKESMSIQLANQLGQFTQLGSFSEGEQSKKVSTQGLADGVYILQLGSNGDALRTKIIVLHK